MFGQVCYWLSREGGQKVATRLCLAAWVAGVHSLQWGCGLACGRDDLIGLVLIVVGYLLLAF